MTQKFTLRQVRQAVRQTCTDAGYVLIENYKKPVEATMTVEIPSSYGTDGKKFLLSCGCNYTLPQETRKILWQTHGEVLFRLLKKNGFRPDPTPYGAAQRQHFVIHMPAKK